MCADHYVVSATVFKRRKNDGRRVQVEYSVDVTERGTFIQDRLNRECGLCDLECLGRPIIPRREIIHSILIRGL